jgi:hypothetical protein
LTSGRLASLCREGVAPSGPHRKVSDHSSSPSPSILTQSALAVLRFALRVAAHAQDWLPAGWLDFTERVSNPLDHYERFPITWSSPFPVLLTLPRFRAKNFSTCTRSTTARGSSIQANMRWEMLPSQQQNAIGTSELDPFRSSILGPWSPL